MSKQPTRFEQATQEVLEGLIQLAYAHAKQTILEKGEELPPIWSIWNKQGELEIIATPWRDDTEKQAARIYMGKKMREFGCILYSFVNEAWFADAPPNWRPGDELSVRPVDNPKRREAVIAIAAAITGGKLSHSWEIVRDPAGKAIDLVRQPEAEAAGGWISSMFGR